MFVCCQCHRSCHMGMHCCLLPPPPVYSLICLVECSTLLFTNEDLYIFLLIAAFLCILCIKSQKIFHIMYRKNSFSFFALVGLDPSDIFLISSMLKVDKLRGIIISQEEMLRCMVGIFKACCKPCRKVLLFFCNQRSNLICDCVRKYFCALQSAV